MARIQDPVKAAEVNRESNKYDDLFRRVSELERLVRVNQQRVPQLIAWQIGSANGFDYTTTSTTLVDVDSANFNFACVVPSGWTLFALGQFAAIRPDTNHDQIQVRLTDITGTQWGECYAGQADATSPQNSNGKLQLHVLGDDRTHQFRLQYANNVGARTIRIYNGEKQANQISYWLIPNQP